MKGRVDEFFSGHVLVQVFREPPTQGVADAANAFACLQIYIRNPKGKLNGSVPLCSCHAEELQVLLAQAITCAKEPLPAV